MGSRTPLLALPGSTVPHLGAQDCPSKCPTRPLIRPWVSLIPRGQLLITAANDHRLHSGSLKVTALERGTAWLDTGTFRSLQDAGEFVRVMEDRTGTKVGCVEEIAWRNGWITSDELVALADPLLKSGYGEYLVQLAGR
jgi:glucose-1-phosphate thymidylyltransferase